MKLKSEKYKGIELEFDVDDEYGTFSGSALGVIYSYKVFNYGWSTLSEAREDLKTQLDEFLESTPTNYTELAEQITSSLVWTGYEDCYADEKIIEVLVGNFIKYNNKNE